MFKHILLTFAFLIAYSGSIHAQDEEVSYTLDGIATNQEISNKLMSYFTEAGKSGRSQQNQGPEKLNDDTNSSRLIKKTVTNGNEVIHRLLAESMMQSIVEPNKTLLASYFKKYGVTPAMVQNFLETLKGNKGTMLYVCENEDFLERYLHAQQLGSPSSYIVRVPMPETTREASALVRATNCEIQDVTRLKVTIPSAQNVKQYRRAAESTKLLQNQKSASKKCRCSCTIL